MPITTKVSVATDGRSLVLTLPSIPPLELETAVVESAIAELGAARARMAPAVSDTHPPRVQATHRDPTMLASAEPLGGGVILHVRDERFGWLDYLITREFAAELGSLLTARSRAPMPSTLGSS